MKKKFIHLAQFLTHGPTYHSLAMWRHPETVGRGYDWTQPELYQHIAKVCERGTFAMVFFAALSYISDTSRVEILLAPELQPPRCDGGQHLKGGRGTSLRD